MNYASMGEESAKIVPSPGVYRATTEHVVPRAHASLHHRLSTIAGCMGACCLLCCLLICVLIVCIELFVMLCLIECHITLLL